jgi:hypothetical protein
MDRRTAFYILLILIIIPVNLEAQRWKLQRYDVAIGIGSTHPFMDIGSQNDGLRSLQVSDTRICIPTHIGFKILEDLSVKLDLNYLMFGGADAPGRREALLKYTSNTFEHNIRAEYNLVNGSKSGGSAVAFNRRGMVNNIGSSVFYLYGGVGGIMSKAKVKYIDGTEVVNNPAYSNNMHWGVVLPAGIGYRRAVNVYIDFSIELGGRFTLTDFVEGYKHPVSEYNDRYFTTSFKAIYKIANDRNGRPKLYDYGRR